MKFQYKITEFDNTNKVVKVEFVDGGWASIQLTAPFPATIEDLSNIVKHYTASKEAVEAKASSVDLSFINSNLNSVIEADRNFIPVQEQPTEEEMALVQELEEAQFKQAVTKVLAEKGLI